MKAVVADGVFNTHSDVEHQAPSASAEATQGHRHSRWTKRIGNHRRPTREACLKLSYINSAVPAGSRITKDLLSWKREVLAYARYDRLHNVNFMRNLENALTHLMSSQVIAAEWTSGPTWDKAYLEEVVGIKRENWANKINWLLEHGFLGKVAYGVTAEYKPKSRQDEGNDGAVYVYCIPVTQEAEVAVDTAVDNIPTLPPEGPYEVSNPPHAHANTTSKVNAPHCLTDKRGFAALTRRLLPALPKLWRGDMTAKASNNKREARASQEQFALTLKHFIPALNSPKISDRHLASVLRRQGFFAAGWTVNDIRYALDRRPDGTPWNHDGANGIGNLAKWLAYRLEPWRDERGWPVQSHYQRQRTERAEALARQRIALDQLQADALVRAGNYAVATGARAPGKGYSAYLAAKAELKLSK